MYLNTFNISFTGVTGDIGVLGSSLPNHLVIFDVSLNPGLAGNWSPYWNGVYAPSLAFFDVTGSAINSKYRHVHN